MRHLTDRELDAFDAAMIAKFGVSPSRMLEHAQSRLLATAEPSHVSNPEPDANTAHAVAIIEHALTELAMIHEIKE